MVGNSEVTTLRPERAPASRLALSRAGELTGSQLPQCAIYLGQWDFHHL